MNNIILRRKFVKREGTNRQTVEVRVVRISPSLPGCEIATYTDDNNDFPDEFMEVPDENKAVWVARGVCMGLETMGFEEQ